MVFKCSESFKKLLMGKHRQRIIILSCSLLLISALVLRIYKVDKIDFWYDEYVSATHIYLLDCNVNAVYDGTRDVREALSAYFTRPSARGDTHPLIYYIILYLFVAPLKLFYPLQVVLRQNPWILRLPSIIFSTISVFVFYRFVTVLCSRKTALYAALIMAINPLQIWYAHEARVYALNYLLCLLLLWRLFSLAKIEEHKRFDPILFSLVVLSVITNPLVFLFILCFLIMTRTRKTILPHILLSLIIFSPFLFLLINKTFWLNPPSLIEVLMPLIHFIIGYNNSIVQILLASVYLMCVLVVSILVLIKSRKKDLNMLLTIYLCPLIIAFICSVFLKPIYLTRYLMFSSIPFYVLIALSLSHIRRKWGKYLLGGIYIVLVFVSLRNYYQERYIMVDNSELYRIGIHPKLDYKDAAHYLEQHVNAQDTVAFTNQDAMAGIRFYLADVKQRYYFIFVPDYLDTYRKTCFNVDTNLHSADIYLMRFFERDKIKESENPIMLKKLAPTKIWIIYSSWERQKTDEHDVIDMNDNYKVSSSKWIDNILIECYISRQ